MQKQRTSSIILIIALFLLFSVGSVALAYSIIDNNYSGTFYNFEWSALPGLHFACIVSSLVLSLAGFLVLYSGNNIFTISYMIFLVGGFMFTVSLGIFAFVASQSNSKFINYR